MPRYTYTAIATDGKRTKGTITAESPYAARKQLRTRSIHPIAIEQLGSAFRGKAALISALARSSKTQLIDSTKQLATLLSSGIKLTEALSVLTMQATDVRFKNALNDIRDRVITGESFADALKDYGDYFDVIYVSMVRVGELTGNLAGTLATIAGFMEKRRRVESKVITAMIYPTFLIGFSLVAVLILTTLAIPTIAVQIERTGRQLPWITRQLMNFSHILTSWRLLVVLVAAAIIFLALRKFLKTQKGAYLRDRFVLSLPMFGALIKQRVVSRFASTLSTLLSSGLPMAESLKVVSEVTGNSIMKQAIQQSRERILAGADIATPLRDSGIIDPAIAHMVAVGEKSGELEMMLKNISESLEASTDIVIERLSAAVEPVIIVFMAVAIGVVAYATLLPILEISALDF